MVSSFRATSVLAEFKRLSPAILTMTESAVEREFNIFSSPPFMHCYNRSVDLVGSNLDRMQERLNTTGKQVNSMKRKGDQIVYDKLGADIVASRSF